jgi:glycosidase
MNCYLCSNLSRALILSVSLLASARAPAAAPVVEKVEPPNWWAGQSLNPVCLLVRGKDLSGAQVQISGRDLQVGTVRSNSSGTYLFVDVTINPGARPGSYPLKIITAGGAAMAPFNVLKPLDSKGRFQGFSPDDVIYLIMPDRFADGDRANDDPAVSKGMYDRQKSRFYHGGDLQGIIDHLAYLKALGVTALWVNPWYENVNQLNRSDPKGPFTDYHGYGAVDFYGVEEHFGDLAELKKLVDAAHRAGIKVIQDQVPNHSGPAHPWVTNPPTPTWLNGTMEKHLNNTWQTVSLTVPDGDPAQRKATLEGWFVNILPDLNQNDPDCARYLIQNSLWWVGVSGLDGIRLDTLPYVPRSFWRDWRAAVSDQYPKLTVVGEMYDGDPRKVAFFQGGRTRFDGVDSRIESLFDFPLYYTIRETFVQGKSMTGLTNRLGQDSLYVNPGMLVTFLGLHDVERFMNLPGADAAGLKLAFTFLLTTRGIPMIYYGDEIGMRGGGDPDNRRDFPGGFPGDAHNAFKAAGRTLEEQSIFDHVRSVLHLRAEFEPLRRGRLVTLGVSDKTYAFARLSTVGTALVFLNAAPEQQTFDLEAQRITLPEGTVLRDRLGKAPEIRVEGGRLKVALAPRSSAIYIARH